jgi:hypothetical protein
VTFGETTVHVAGPGDGERIASAWLDAGAYYAALDPDYTMTPSVTEVAELWDAVVGTDDPASLALVAERDDRVIGWLLARSDIEAGGGTARGQRLAFACGPRHAPGWRRPQSEDPNRSSRPSLLRCARYH